LCLSKLEGKGGKSKRGDHSAYCLKTYGILSRKRPGNDGRLYSAYYLPLSPAVVVSFCLGSIPGVQGASGQGQRCLGLIYTVWLKIQFGRDSAKIISHSDTTVLGVVDRVLFPRGAFWLGSVGGKQEKENCLSVVLLSCFD